MLWVHKPNEIWETENWEKNLHKKSLIIWKTWHYAKKFAKIYLLLPLPSPPFPTPITPLPSPPFPTPITSTNRQNLLKIKGILKFKTQHFTDSVSWSVSKKSRLTIISAQATEFILVELGFLRSLGNILVLCSDCRNMSTIMPSNACLITEYRLAWLGELPQSTWPPVRGLCSGIVWNLGQELRAITYVSYTVMVLS